MLHILRWLAIGLGAGVIWLMVSPDRLWRRGYRARDKRGMEFAHVSRMHIREEESA